MPILQMCRRRLAQGNSASKGRHKDSNPRPAWAKAYAAALPFFRCPPLLPIVVIGPSSRHQLFWACQVPNSQTVTQVPQRQGGGDTPLDTALPRHLLRGGGGGNKGPVSELNKNRGVFGPMFWGCQCLLKSPLPTPQHLIGGEVRAWGGQQGGPHLPGCWASREAVRLPSCPRYQPAHPGQL